MMAVHTLVLKHAKIVGNWEARVKMTEDLATEAEHERDKVARREAKLKEQTTSQSREKGDALVKERTRTADAVA